MRYIFWQGHKTLIRNFVFLIMGIYVGIFISLYFHGNQIDELMDKNEKLALELKTSQDKVNTYEQAAEKRTQKQLIRSVKFHFQEELESFIETELLKVLMDETHFLIGKKVDDVGKSPEFIEQLLNKKIFKAKDKKFEITVKTIYIQSTIEIRTSVKEIKVSN